MSDTAPATTIAHLPWSSAMPDMPGYWWFTSDIEDGVYYGFVEHVPQEEIEEGVLNLDSLHISRMDAERWEKTGFYCCPVVLPAEHSRENVLAKAVKDIALLQEKLAQPPCQRCCGLGAILTDGHLSAPLWAPATNFSKFPERKPCSDCDGLGREPVG
jgi:hypothetical protein